MNLLWCSWLMGEWSYPALAFLLAGMVKSSLIVLAAWGLALMLRHRSALARSWVWRAALVALASIMVWTLTPGQLDFLRPRIRVEADGVALQTVANAARRNSIIETRPIPQPGPPVAEPSSWPGFNKPLPSLPLHNHRVSWLRGVERGVLLLWWAVASLLVLWRLLRAGCGAWWLRRHSTVAHEEMLSQASAAGRALGIRQAPLCRLVDELASPVVTGFLTPTIWLPAVSASWSASKLRAVFLHELAHHRRKDGAWQWLAWFTASAWWWNPLVWLAIRRLAAEAELSADELVLAHQMPAPEYAAALVEIAAGITRSRPAVGVPMLGRSAIEQRVRAILAVAPWRGRLRWPAKVLIVCIALTAILASGLAVRPTAAHAETMPIDATSRALIEKALPLMQKRLQALRFIHFTMEERLSVKDPATGQTLKAPSPSIIEGWVEEGGVLHRVEYKPQVTRWTNGAGPFYIGNTTAVGDREHSWSIYGDRDIDHLQLRPQEMVSLIGLQHEREAMDILDQMRNGTPVHWGSDEAQVAEADADGRRVLRLTVRPVPPNEGRIETWEIDLAEGGLVRRHTMTYRSSTESYVIDWQLEEVAHTADGIAYPQRFNREDRRDQKEKKQQREETIVSIVKSLETIKAIPPALLEKPKPAVAPYTATDDTVQQGSEIELRHVNALDGSPLPKVKVDYEVNGGKRLSLASDDQGVVHIPLPKEEVKSLLAWGMAKGFVMQQVRWHRYGNPLRLPASYTVKLYPASPISGTVVNEEGQPVAGAEVVIMHSGSTQRWGVFADIYANYDRTARTNAKGKWRMDGFPPDLTGLYFRVSHPDYSRHLYTDYRTATATDYGTLRDGSSRIVIQRGLTLKGQVVNQQNQPVAGCEVIVAADRNGYQYPSAITAADGSFTLVGLEPGKQWVTAQGGPWHPWMQEVEIPAGGAAPLRIVMEPGRVLRVRLMLENGKPAAKTRAVPDKWRNHRTLSHDMWTDDEGRFEWAGAPADAVLFTFLVDGGLELRDLPVTATGGEQTVVLHPAVRVLGKVINASTGQPLKQFSVMGGDHYGDNRQTIWNSTSRRTFKDGAFGWTGSWMSHGMRLKIEAEGFLPLETVAFQPRQQTESVALKLIPLGK